MNDQTGPGMLPLLFFATICQKYVVLLASVVDGLNDVDVWVTTNGGGLTVPKRTS